MRELKFRAWDSEEHEMSDPMTMRQLLTYSPLDDDSADNLMVMQYTGLHDADGVEIYEGDIVGWGTHLEVKEVVFYNPEGAAFETESSMLDKCMVVIGNIHENPELVNA